LRLVANFVLSIARAVPDPKNIHKMLILLCLQLRFTRRILIPDNS